MAGTFLCLKISPEYLIYHPPIPIYFLILFFFSFLKNLKPHAQPKVTSISASDLGSLGANIKFLSSTCGYIELKLTNDHNQYKALISQTSLFIYRGIQQMPIAPIRCFVLIFFDHKELKKPTAFWWKSSIYFIFQNICLLNNQRIVFTLSHHKDDPLLFQPNIIDLSI